MRAEESPPNESESENNSASASKSKSETKSRENSLEMGTTAAEDTLSRLRDLDVDSRHSRKSNSSAHANAHANARHMEKMGQSLNFLNLDRRSMTPLTAPTKTIGGANPRVALMQLRIKRLKKTSPTERLYQSDSALFGGDHQHNKANARDAVWFKSSYPTLHTLEKLDEAEQEFEESTHRSNSAMGGDDNIYGDMPELDDFNTSSTDLWLHGNQSAPGDFQRRPNAAYMDDEDDEDKDHSNNSMSGAAGTGRAAGAAGAGKQGKEMVDESIQIV